MATSDSTDKLLDELPEGKKPEEIFGKKGLVKDRTKRLVELALEGEITHHPGYEPNSPTGRNSGNPRNCKTLEDSKIRQWGAADRLEGAQGRCRRSARHLHGGDG